MGKRMLWNFDDNSLVPGRTRCVALKYPGDSISNDSFIILSLPLDNEEYHAMEAWRLKSNLPSRTAAVKHLMRRGLAAEGLRVEQDQSYKD
jgi:hypothetical protein